MPGVTQPAPRNIGNEQSIRTFGEPFGCVQNVRQARAEGEGNVEQDEMLREARAAYWKLCFTRECRTKAGWDSVGVDITNLK